MVGRFVIIDALGEGATGTVYSAFDPVASRQVALKVLCTGRSDSSGKVTVRRARVLREAQAMPRIRHRNVVTVHDVGPADDQSVFFAMKRIDGGTITDWLKGPHSWREVVRIFCAAGDGLVAAHQAGVIHRDFKPDNILMDEGSVPRVTDFGLARAGKEAVEHALSAFNVIETVDCPESLRVTVYLNNTAAMQLGADRVADAFASATRAKKLIEA